MLTGFITCYFLSIYLFRPRLEGIAVFKKTISIVGLVGVLAAVYYIEIWLEESRSASFETLNFAPRLWVLFFYNLLFACSIIVLFWLTNLIYPRSKLVNSVYLLVGLLVALSIPLHPILQGTLPRSILATPAFMSTTGAFPLAGSFSALIGLYGLLTSAQTKPALQSVNQSNLANSR